MRISNRKPMAATVAAGVTAAVALWPVTAAADGPAAPSARAAVQVNHASAQGSSAAPGERAKAAALAPAAAERKMADRARAQAVADEIRAEVREQRLASFTGLRIAPRIVTLYWKGKVPADLQDLIDTEPVPVEVREARFSRSQLLRAAEEFMDSPPGRLGAEVTATGPVDNFSALEVGTDRPVSQWAPEQYAGIPVTYTVQPAPQAVSRQADTEPYWGGAAIRSALTGRQCSTGFPVRLADGQEGLLTAEHCGAGQEWLTAGVGRTVGSGEWGSGTVDAMVITGRSYGSYHYVGPNGTAEDQGRQAVGAADPAVGSLVYASGAASGESTVYVTRLDQYAKVDGRRVGPGFRTVNLGGLPSIGSGDSGAPVATVDAYDPTRSVARGMVDAVYAPTAQQCTGPRGQRCSQEAFHINIEDALRALGAQVRTPDEAPAGARHT